MIEYDEQYYDKLKLTKADRIEYCRRDIMLALSMQLPTAIPVEDLQAIYSRYFSHTKTVAHRAAFRRFLHQLELERIVLVEYDRNENPVSVALKQTEKTRKMLGLPHCLVEHKCCNDAGCRHRDECEFHRLNIPDCDKKLSNAA